ncbi:MAG: zeta toxin family protein [Candidatus Moranbacteria bacterium]|nr:zeta toxin family protein [Candidatus Moranbacteria bacterium]
MRLTLKEQRVADEARQWVRSHQLNIIDHFVGSVEPVEFPVSIFMAGSPGAGKTEFSKRLIKRLGGNIVRIDADDIRDMLPQYQGKNSYVVHGAAALGVEKVYDFVLKKRLHALLDGTFQKYEKATDNIRRSLKYERSIDIFYVYQDPLVAWDFTQKREVVEGRNILKGVFVDAFFASYENVKRVKLEYDEAVRLNVVFKDISNHDEEIWYNVDIDQIDSYVKIGYTRTELEKRL